MTDRIYLWCAQVFFAAGLLVTLRRLRRGAADDAPHQLGVMAVLGGFLCQTVFLMLRGQRIGSCPLTNTFEGLMFVMWAAVLFYLLIGHSYRVSFLGLFTAPVVLVISVGALLAAPAIDRRQAPLLPHQPWVELHAAIAVLAYGAFALAFGTGLMYLHQERQLKSRHLSASFLAMPAIERLDTINFRLIVTGFAMLTAGMIGGFVSYRQVGHVPVLKVVSAVTAWLVYAAVLVARLVWSLRGRKVALVSIFSFAFVLVMFWGLNLLVELHRATP